MGLSNQNQHFVYAQVTCGKYETKEGGVPREFNCLEGTLESISCYWDKGSPENHVAAHDAFQAVLIDGDTRYVLKGSLGNKGEATTFGWMFASYIDGVAKGERIKVDVWPGTDNDKVSCCKIHCWDGGQYRPAIRKEFPSDRAERLIEAKSVIKDHEAYVRAEKDNDPAMPTAEDMERGSARVVCDAEIKFWQVVASWSMVGYLNAVSFWNEFLGKLLMREVSSLNDIGIHEWALLLEFANGKKAAGKVPNSISKYLADHGQYDPFADE